MLFQAPSTRKRTSAGLALTIMLCLHPVNHRSTCLQGCAQPRVYVGVRNKQHYCNSMTAYCDNILTLLDDREPIVRTVLDPFTSLSLASAVCQFIDFSGTLFSKSRNIYKSTTGYDDDTDSLLGITQDLRSLTEKLEPGVDPSSLTSEEADLVNLSDKCRRIANELLLVLEDLQNSKTSRWSSFRAALRSTWAQDRIDDMARKLESYRSQLILRLTFMQRSVIFATLSTLQNY